jgi:hypothetical protein
MQGKGRRQVSIRVVTFHGAVQLEQKTLSQGKCLLCVLHHNSLCDEVIFPQTCSRVAKLIQLRAKQISDLHTLDPGEGLLRILVNKAQTYVVETLLE